MSGRAGQQQIRIADGVKSGRAAEGAAEFMTAGGFSDVMDNDESRLGGVAQADEGLAESGHGAGVVFILVMSGVEGIDDNDIGLNRTGGVEEVIKAGGGAEQMTRDAGVDEEIGVGAVTNGFAHGGQAESELGRGQFELADKDTLGGRDLKAGVIAA